MPNTVREAIPLKSLLVSAGLSAIAYVDPNEDDHIFHRLRELGPFAFFDASSKEDASVSAEGRYEFHDTQAYGWFSREAKRVYIFFRGTDSKKDMLANLDVRTSYIKKACVHRGFQEQFMAVRDDIQTFLDKYTHGYDHVVFCGHSLGGAIATIASAYFAQSLGVEVKVSCHTFGAPRVGNRAFSKHMNALIPKQENWRIYHARDPVCFIPMSFRFCHVKNTGLCIQHGSGKMKMRPYDTPWYLRAMEMMTRWQCMHPFEHHSIENYIKKLETHFDSFENK